MVNLVRSLYDGRYHRPDCPYRAKGSLVWVWAKDKSLFAVVSETFEKKENVQPCKHCIMKQKIKPADFEKEREN